ncbi:trehalase family glycosidase [Tatlockia sp. PL877]|nr:MULTISPECIES: alpha,alpha-trehalase [unclassified Legionella]MDI9818981.1 trehalase family glycosidase [Legionella sp. PL877]
MHTLNSQVSHYIESSWDKLTRNDKNWYESNIDTKLPGAKFIVYLPAGEDISRVRADAATNLSPQKLQALEFRYLPRDISKIDEHGLLYLPHPYVVPGGRFNEMYGWDSYFIELGLLQNNRLALARNMVDNIIYEINNYGMVLNANRTYYLERSHPPLLTAMIMAYYQKSTDKHWLKATLPAIDKLYKHWTTPPHLIPEIGLSRYHAGGKGATPEESPDYYAKALDYFKTQVITDYDKSLYYDEQANQLTELFYIADRSVRESGLDITAKYGPFSAAILDYAPVDLNVFLCRMEQDASEIHTILGNPKAAAIWAKRAKKRADLINRYLWDEQSGYYYDYNFKTHRLKPYVYATTFYPLWAGVASRKQAAAVANHLPELLMKGGLVTSTNHPGLQWDAPFGWAPMQYFAVSGLNNYGYKKEAIEIAQRFINTVNKGYQQSNTIFEKYDVEKQSALTTDKIKFSYSTNEMGFGWTNGVYLTFIDFIQTAG